MSVYDAALWTEISKRISIFGLRLWFVIGILIGLLPQLEISLFLIEECFSAKGLNIVGYFNPNERSDDYELSGVAKKVDDHICHYFPQATILLLDNKKLEALLSNTLSHRDSE